VVKARKRFGQHFLEPAWVAKLVAAIEPEPDDPFVEIGPGKGAITLPLLQRSGRVLAIEVDRDLAAALRSSERPGLTVVQADVLETDLASLVQQWQGAPLGPSNQVRVVGNLPYNISSPILFKLLAAANEGRSLTDATLMLQKEVVDRIVAKPGTGDYGTLAIQVALVADVERLLTLPPGAFRPPPKVTSAVVRLTFRRVAEDVGSRDVFEKIVRGIFLQRRKTLANALKPVADALGQQAEDLIQRADVDGRKRPEALTLGEIARLCRAVV